MTQEEHGSGTKSMLHKGSRHSLGEQRFGGSAGARHAMCLHTGRHERVCFPVKIRIRTRELLPHMNKQRARTYT